MVSIFGLKIGGDKKKKSEQAKSKPAPEQVRRVCQGPLNSNMVTINNGCPGMVNISSTRSTAQTDASPSNLLTPNGHALQAFYNPNGPALASASMNDLTRTTSPGVPELQPLKPAVSNPTLGTRWNNGSTPSLTVSSDPISRPATSGRDKIWVDPLDVHFTKGQSAVPSVKSPLSGPQDEFPDTDPETPLSDAGDFNPLPKALNISKQRAPIIPARSALRNPPSPPPSVRTQSEKGSSEIDRFSILERPIVPIAAGDGRPSSRGSHRNIPTSLRELMAADDFAPNSPISIPTPPPSLPRASNEAGNRASMNEWGEPVIQTVRAKRETMTISADRRRSLEKLIDSLAPVGGLNKDGRPRTSSGPRARRPILMRLNMDIQTSNPDGPNSAPFAARQRSESPFGRTLQRPARAGVPPAAVGALGRPSRPNRQGIRRPTADEYGIAPLKLSEDRYENASPPDSPIMPTSGPLAGFEPPDSPIMPTEGFLARSESPDSPIIPAFGPLASPEPPDSPIMPLDGPLSSAEPPDSPILPVRGPLASPMFFFDDTKAAEPRRDQLDTNFRFPDWSVTSESRSDSAASVVPSLTLDEIPSAQSVDWPLSVSNVADPDSPSLLVRAQSPFAIPSFSRPWTPTNIRPGTPTNVRSVMPVKTTELALPTGLRGPSASPRAPPPRIVPVYALKNSPIVSVTEYSEVGFI